MDIESAGAGMGGGILSAILIALGIKSRIDKLEANVVYKDACVNCGKGNSHQFRALHDGQVRIENKIDTVLVNLSRRREDNQL